MGHELLDAAAVRRVDGYHLHVGHHVLPELVLGDLVVLAVGLGGLLASVAVAEQVADLLAVDLWSRPQS